MTLYEVQTVDEAVALAKKLKGSGSHDWFRGQISNWPLKSTYVRLQPDARKESKEKLVRFLEWVANTRGLDRLATDADSVVAVAQHYGLPTNFIDFTTSPEVAGFFASYGNPTEGMKSCILCLDTTDLLAFWVKILKGYRPPECLRLEVPDLWRLEAQCGVFLFCPHENFEFFYDLDRITFPYTGLIASPRIEEMYPQRKSHLEILLDQNFMNERLIEGHRALKKMNLTIPVHHMDSLPNRCDPEVIKEGDLPKESSWHSERIEKWLTLKHEKYSDTGTEELWDFVLDRGADPTQSGNEFSRFVLEGFENTPGIRSKLVSFTLRFNESSAESIKQGEFLSRSVQRLWDGVRNLPHVDSDVASGLGATVALYLSMLNVKSVRFDTWLEVATRCFGSAIEIEFGAEDGSYARGYVSSADLLSAVRKDFIDYLHTPFQGLSRNVTQLLLCVQAPERLFDFDRLAALFARQIVPSQVLTRTSGAVFFSPARLSFLGLP